jgi:hypothetical protein
MKIKYSKFIVLILSLSLCNGCLLDEHKDVVPECEIQANGLSRAINDLVPDKVLQQMITLGMLINGGGSPPIIETSTYKLSPAILLSSNIPKDPIGGQFDDVIVTFSQQNLKKLNITVDYINGNGTGKGIGSFVAGEGNKFSIFSQVDSENVTQAPGIKAKTVFVFSGTLTPTGIQDFHTALFMVDDAGDPAGIWIEIGQGRVSKDGDGFSEKL